jgi:alkanesulfonate monooxygenase SsuD/methylene tetrahydromethanopterin reductase-like flavin-dependent oxidoreductase (luciferase family)
VEIDIFCEVEKANLKPGEEGQLLRETLAQAELADKMGYGCWWEVEHHGAVEMSYSSAPEVILSAIAQRTKRIRIGHAAALAPHNINHPVRVAERAATLDLLSNGRLEMGFARSTVPEWRTFQIDPSDTRRQQIETMRMVPQMWTQERFSWDGEDIKIKDLSVIPKPQQKPHPPMWSMATSEDGFKVAGEAGVGVVGVTLMLPLDTMAQLFQTYRTALKTADPVGSFVNAQTGVFTFVHCAETMDKAIENGAAAAMAWYQNAIVKFFELKELLLQQEQAVLAGLAEAGGHDGVKLDAGAGLIGDIRPEGINEQDELTQATLRIVGRLARGEEITNEEVYNVLNKQDSVIIGDPPTVRRKMERYRDIGTDRLLCFQQVGGLAHSAVMDSIRLVGEEVIPYLAPR